MMAEFSIKNYEKIVLRLCIEARTHFGTFTKLDALSRVGATEYVTTEKISGVYGIESDALDKTGVLKGVDYIVLRNRKRAYIWGQVVRRMADLGYYAPTVHNPMDEISVDLMILDTGVDRTTFFRLIKRGVIRPHRKPGESCEYLYLYEYDRFLRQYFIADNLRWLGTTPLRPRDAATFCGYKNTKTLTEAVKYKKRLTRHSIQTKSRTLYNYTKADLSQWATGCNRAFRRETFPDALPKPLAAMYMRRSVADFEKISSYLPNPPGHASYYTREGMDAWYMSEWCVRAYGEQLFYYTPSTIRAKFKRSYAWINAYVRGHCDVYTKKRETLTQEQFHEKYPGRPDKYPYIFGFDKASVEQVVKTAPLLPPGVSDKQDARPGKRRRPRGVEQLTWAKWWSSERKRARTWKQRKTYEKQCKKNEEKRKKRAELFGGDVEYDHMKMSDFELGLKAALMKTELERDNRRYEAERKGTEEENRLNEMRGYLGIKERSVRLSPKKVFRLSKIPMNVYLVHTIGYNGGLFAGRLPEKGVCVLHGKPSFNWKKAAGTRLNTFNLLARLHRRVLGMHPATTPGWYVIVGSGSIISDLKFPEKLRAVPDDVAAVGAFGYGEFNADGSWVGSRSTYGVYSTFDGQLDNTEWVVGAGGHNDSNPVAVIDGPFIAVRGIYASILAELDQFTQLVDGDVGQYVVNAVISLALNRMGLPLMQIPVECSMCREQPISPGTLQWNQLELPLIKFYRHK